MRAGSAGRPARAESRATRRAACITRAALALCAALLAVGCGHRGAPRPPLPRIPEEPRAVYWWQRGDHLEVVADYRLQALEGRTLRPPVRPVVLWVPARSPGEAESWRARPRAGEFRRSAAEVPLEPFPETVLGTRTRARRSVSLDPFGRSVVVVLALAVRDRRARSFPSPRRTWQPLRPALPAPGTVQAIPEETGVRLRWSIPADSRARFVDVYRAVGEGNAFPPEPWRRVDASSGELLDEDARYGQLLRYQVAYAADVPGIPVESLPVVTDPVRYLDVFPPAAPRGLDVVPEPGGVRVLWAPGGSRDEARVEIYRQVEGSREWTLAGTVDVPGATFLDTGLDPGRRYRYRLIAVDVRGNRSKPAGPTAWERPREGRR